jgi:hypothetical protein
LGCRFFFTSSKKTLRKNNISPQKPNFENIENVMVISIKILDCLNIFNPYLPKNWTFRRELKTRNRIIEAYAECQGILF